MRLLFRPLGLALAVAACAAQAGCSSSSSSKTTLMLPPPPPDTATLAFDDPATLKLAPGATQALYVTATPPRTYAVGFALLGDPGDGSLDNALVFTGEDGR